MSHTTAPMPDLRIVEVERLRPHEDHDSQRSKPLVDRLRHEPTIINPPVVAPLPGGDFVILDGANRVFALRAIDCPHVLVQVAPYHTGAIELDLWRHVVCDWTIEALFEEIARIPGVQLLEMEAKATPDTGTQVASILATDGTSWTIEGSGPDARTNSPVRALVQIYQQRATLQRTALTDPDEIWDYHPTGAALIAFRAYKPEDIMRAAVTGDFLPPGVSRHIVHGRAIRVNYPMLDLRDPYTPLERKNESLRRWVQERIAARRVRYYAEATFQFDE